MPQETYRVIAHTVAVVVAVTIFMDYELWPTPS